MTIDSMRVGGGRCPPLIVGGLIIACIMMVCNWWTLSSTNLELLRQIDELNEQIKISVEERDQCVTQRGNFEKQLSECQVNTRRINVKLSQVEEESNTNKKELDSYKALDVHKTATLDTMRVSQKAIQIQLNSQQAENKKLEEDKKQLEEEKKQLVEEKKKLEEELDKVKNELKDTKLAVNVPPMNQLPDMPIASTTPIISSAQLAPVKIRAVHVSKIGDKGIIYHNIPILPDDPPGAVRRAPRFSVTMLKS